ncbi:MAG TPA: polysaccharide biosynthesis tyrosine autokinase [Thermoanaerobaculia bacterium]|nr:polysaccharide biosynthesis tyrosine autokinase [Thermoanaerobaculia bacterium]
MSVQDPFASEPRAAEAGVADSLGDWKEYLHGFRRRWRLIALVFLLVVLGSLVQYALTPPVYKATTMLQIERRSLASTMGPQAAWLDLMYSMEYYPTQYHLLESRGVAEEVVRLLDLTDDPTFNTARRRETAAEGTAEANEAEVARLANRVRAGLEVEPIKGTQLVRLNYQSSSAPLAAKIVDGYAQTFIAWGKEKRDRAVSETSRVLRSQVEELKNEIEKGEESLAGFSRQYSVSDYIPDADASSLRLTSLNTQFMEAKRLRIEKEARYSELQRMPAQAAASLGARTADSLTQELRSLERDYETKLLTFKEEWPEMVDLRDQIEKVRGDLDAAQMVAADTVVQQARSEYLAALRQEQTLGSEIERLKQEIMASSSVAVQYATLRGEVTSRRALLDQLVRRQSETDVAVGMEGGGESSIRVVEKATMPGSPAQPSLQRSLSMGVGGGLLLGFGLALLLELLDRTVKSGGEVERLLGLPVLAVVPDVSEEGRLGRYRRYGYGYGQSITGKEGGAGDKARSEPASIELIPHHRPRLAVSETYRALRTALLLSSAQRLASVAVTSASAGEGKTSTSSNLATVMAQQGWRVLMIDADMRKPRLHAVFEVSNRLGLVNVLAEGTPVDEVVASTGIPNVWVIPSGPIPPNPSELLGSNRMKELIRRAEERFDFVVIDTPPVLVVTDATVVGTLVNGVVLCLRAGRVTRDDARACRDRLVRADVKVLGVVLNGRRLTDAGFGGHYYQYYAAYGEETQQDSSAA